MLHLKFHKNYPINEELDIFEREGKVPPERVEEPLFINLYLDYY